MRYLTRMHPSADGYAETFEAIIDLYLVSSEKAKEAFEKLNIDQSFEIVEYNSFLQSLTDWVELIEDIEPVKENDGLQLDPKGVTFYINDIVYVRSTEQSVFIGDMVRVIYVSERKNITSYFDDGKEDGYDVYGMPDFHTEVW